MKINEETLTRILRKQLEEILNSYDPFKCRACNGRGTVPGYSSRNQYINGDGNPVTKCSRCGGKGHLGNSQNN